MLANVARLECTTKVVLVGQDRAFCSVETPAGEENLLFVKIGNA